MLRDSPGGSLQIGEEEEEGWSSDTCGRHAGSVEVGVGWGGCCLSLLYAGPQREAASDWLHCSLWGFQS